MTKTNKWLLFVCISFFIISLSYFVRDVIWKPSKKIRDLKSQIVKGDKETKEWKHKFYEKGGELRESQKLISQSKTEYDILKKEFDTRIKPPTIIRTLTKEKIIKEYETVYILLDKSLNRFGFTVESAIDINKKVNEFLGISESYIKSSENTTTKRNKLIKIYERKQRRWGIHFGIKLLDSKMKTIFNDFEFVLSIGYRIL